MTYASQPADLVYSLDQGDDRQLRRLQGRRTGRRRPAVSAQNLTWVLPYHEGAVKALKEAGVWKPEHEAHNQASSSARMRWRAPGPRS